MRLDTIESNLRLLIYLYTNPDCDLQTIEKNTGIGYSTLHKTLENWRKSKHITKKRLPPVLGGIKVHYKLSEKGINFFENLLSLLPSLQENTLKQRISDLYDILPDILTELRITLDDTQNKKLRNKIKNFLKI